MRVTGPTGASSVASLAVDANAWAAIAAWAGFAVAAVAALVARWQARSASDTLTEARKASQAAQDQARTAREAAREARKAADAAVDQAHSTRESVEIARAAYDREDRPTFELARDDQRGDVFVVVVRMLTGPPEIIVTARWSASSEGPAKGDARRIDHETGASPTHRLVPSDRIKVRVGVPSWATKATIRLDLDCSDKEDGGRTWEVAKVLEWEVPQVQTVRRIR